MEEICKDVDGIFHQAALTVVQESYTKKEQYYKVNVEGTENIFNLAKKYNFKVIFASSSSIYGKYKSYSNQKRILIEIQLIRMVRQN